jgi:hypothetical protein
MATATKRSADYDPIEEALDIGHNLGREQERKRQQPKLEAARRGAERRAKASARREFEETEQQHKADKAVKDSQRRKARNERRESEMASARRGAFASGAAKAKRDAAGQARTVGGSARAGGAPPEPQLSAPTTTIGSGVSGGIDRTQGSRLILVITGLSAILAIANSARQSSPTTSVIRTGNGETVKVPSHLQSLGGVFVVGTICLVLNEVSPGIAVALSAMLGIDLLATAFGKGGVANAFGSGLFRGVSQVGPIPAQGKPGYLGSGTSNTTQAPGPVPSGLQPPIGVLPAPSGSKDAQTATPKRSASPTLPEKVANWLNVIGI